MTVPLQDNIIISIGEAPASVNLCLTLIKPGRFLMGEGEQVHEIYFTIPFYMGTFPITQAQWSAIFPTYNPPDSQCLNSPVNQVSWYDIVDGTQEDGPPEAFLTRINRQLQKQPGWSGHIFRLPTEAEWEYAAKDGHLASQLFEHDTATTDLYSKYAGGNELNAVGWFEINNDIGTHPVGRKQPNLLGLYDLSGNVWEWCADAYVRQIYQERTGRITEDPPAVGVTKDDQNRVLRGGSWIASAESCRVSYRYYDAPDYRDIAGGFRLVLAPVRASE